MSTPYIFIYLQAATKILSFAIATTYHIFLALYKRIIIIYGQLISKFGIIAAILPFKVINSEFPSHPNSLLTTASRQDVNALLSFTRSVIYGSGQIFDDNTDMQSDAAKIDASKPTTQLCEAVYRQK